MDAKNIILSQLSACYNQNNWFVSLNSLINGLSADHASWKSNETVNSIWEIVTHLATVLGSTQGFINLNTKYESGE
ncbi:hypothetical protein PGC35_16985 [Psychrobacillus sp. PGGUH221]|uniref:hypothetical protein n=1 Tax=Psychrobacillus sp. PGGUH221 TaxID=3020058 RepID=UPI0035C66BB9